MLEYFNYGGFTVFTLLAIVMLIVDSDKKKRVPLYIFLLVSVTAFLLLANYEYTTAQQNINNFKNKNTTLKCMSGGGIHSVSSTYRVSLNNGWQIDKEYFIKDSLAVRINRCERW